MGCTSILEFYYNGHWTRNVFNPVYVWACYRITKRKVQVELVDFVKQHCVFKKKQHWTLSHRFCYRLITLTDAIVVTRVNNAMLLRLTLREWLDCQRPRRDSQESSKNIIWIKLVVCFFACNIEYVNPTISIFTCNRKAL